MLLYEVCDQANIDATTQQCSAPQWVQAPSLIPPMDSTSGFAIGAAILAAWALAAVFRKM